MFCGKNRGVGLVTGLRSIAPYPSLGGIPLTEPYARGCPRTPSLTGDPGSSAVTLDASPSPNLARSRGCPPPSPPSRSARPSQSGDRRIPLTKTRRLEWYLPSLVNPQIGGPPFDAYLSPRPGDTPLQSGVVAH